MLSERPRWPGSTTTSAASSGTSCSACSPTPGGGSPRWCSTTQGPSSSCLVLFRAVQDPSVFLVVAAVNGFFTLGQFAWMPVYLPELFPTVVRGSAISLVFDVT